MRARVLGGENNYRLHEFFSVAASFFSVASMKKILLLYETSYFLYKSLLHRRSNYISLLALVELGAPLFLVLSSKDKKEIWRLRESLRLQIMPHQ